MLLLNNPPPLGGKESSMVMTKEQRDALMGDIPDEARKVLPADAGKKAGLEYIKAQYPMLMLSTLFGPDGWYSEVVECRFLAEEQVNGRWHVSYMAHVRITIDGVGKENVGTHTHKASSKPEAHSNAAMGAVSIGIKRACVMWGRALGLALYEDDADAELVDKLMPNRGERSPATSLEKQLALSIQMAKNTEELRAARTQVAAALQQLSKVQVKKLTSLFTQQQLTLAESNNNGE